VSTPPRRPGTTQYLRPRRFRDFDATDDYKFGALDKVNKAKQAEAALTAAQVAEIQSYRRQHPKKSASKVAEHFSPLYGRSIRTLRRKIGELPPP
jgi:hypothetical protein